ncbi:MAG: bifunctional adenosylcobinamide kinase/adenosylcobinamide-phosphate guanylyltransferase [Candidatus Gastranaerophilales bacterium]|nr:bifunctional adenosylcobinamide kinase/adenosylcobinamide-phosphate guanylyltransferase [Candidatus Gastranaerophilales bacterium]
MILITGGAYQGKRAFADNHFSDTYRIVDHYHETIRLQMKQGMDPLKEAQKLLSSDDKLVIICDEVGCGLVPVDAFERAYREQVGRVGGYLAGEAGQVIRVICGIGKNIKP